MIDYIDITKHLEYKDTINLMHLQLEASYSSNWNKYFIKGCRQLEIWINPILAQIRIKGSVPYFFQGHNFTFNNKAFSEVIAYLNQLLKCDLWNAVVNSFEYGVIFEVSTKPSEYIQHHREKPKEGLILNEKVKDKGCFRWWEDKWVKLKMYDAGKNIKYKQDLSMRKTIENEGWKPQINYLKWEIHYKKPHLALNKGIAIILADLVNPRWTKKFKDDLFSQYQRLAPRKNIASPINKKEISSANIIMLELCEAYINEGYSIQEIKKKLYNRINTFEVLSESDKKARKRQTNHLIAKLSESKTSEWDLSDFLSKKIFQERE